jgi:hypothetical protein
MPGEMGLVTPATDGRHARTCSLRSGTYKRAMPHLSSMNPPTPNLPMFRQLVLVLAGDRDTLTAAHGRAVTRGLPISIFTEDLFTTGNDRDNHAAVRVVPTSGLRLVGIGVYGPKNAVDKTLKGAALHR